MSEQSSWKLGYAQADITPESGEAMLTGFGRQRISEGVHTPLRAQVLAFQDSAGKQAVWLFADWLGFDPYTVAAMRSFVQEEYALAPEALLMSASHTHWSPGSLMNINPYAGPVNPFYISRIETLFRELIRSAFAAPKPCSIRYTACDLRAGMNRRQKNPNGYYVMLPNPDGPYDTHTPVLEMTWHPGGKALFFGHACHPTASGGLMKWSADWPGTVRDILERAMPGTHAIFAMGCGADAKALIPASEPPTFAASPEQSAAAGAQFAADLLVQLGKAEWHDLAPTLNFSRADGELTFGPSFDREALAKEANEQETGRAFFARQLLQARTLPSSLPYEVAVWRLGALTLIAMEGEVCSPWGPRSRDMAGGLAMTLGYTNRNQAYIPDNQIVREGGYEGHSAHRPYALPGPFSEGIEAEVEDILRRALHP